MKTLLLAAAAAAFVGAPALAQSAVLGSWDATIESPQGEMMSTITFTETDGAIAVNVTEDPAATGGFELISEFTDVEVEGDSFSFVRVIDFQGTPFEVSYSGTVEGDALTGEVDSEMGAAPMSGTRAATAE